MRARKTRPGRREAGGETFESTLERGEIQGAPPEEEGRVIG